ncbi:hypothetical protein ABT369_39465 [Dactylosporangium sp. NPDC000244]|uniref:hypothetical protein n=1 Tax=Dactylosporangium sp. NPDC000244 TaxID=3154365 RepID=UPI003324DCA3
MPQLVIKPARHRDEYVVWSTVTETPVTYGCRRYMTRWLAADRARHVEQERPLARLRRADRLGSSAYPQWGDGHWDDDIQIYEQRGILHRRDLYRAARLACAGRDAEVWDLLEPFEDETEVRRG